MVRVHAKSLVQYSTYNFLIDFHRMSEQFLNGTSAHNRLFSAITFTEMHLFCIVFELQQVICQKSPILTHPICI